MGITFGEINGNCSRCPLSTNLGCCGLVGYASGPVHRPCKELDKGVDAQKYSSNLVKYGSHGAWKIEKQAEKERENVLQEKRDTLSNKYCKQEIKKEKRLKKSCEILKESVEKAKLALAFAEINDELGMTKRNTNKLRIRLTKLQEKRKKQEEKLAKVKEQIRLKRLVIQETEEYKNIK